MEIVELFLTASIPVVKVLLVTGVGSYLALDHINVLGEDARKHVNTLVFYVLNPALVASNLASTITYQSMLKLWFMPINVLITFIVGSALGWILIRITRPPPRLRGLILGCSAAGNLGNLPFIIVPALCKENGSPFGDPDVCYTHGMAYVSLSMAIGAIYLWSYVYNIVRVSSEAAAADSDDTTKPLLSSDPFQLPLKLEDESGEAQGLKQKLGMVFRKLNVKAILAPSTMGAVAGFVIGVVPLLRRSLIGSGAPLRVIQDAATLIGDGAIPTLTLIVGGNLLKGLRGSSGIQKSVIMGIIIARYVVLPVVGIAVVKGAVYLGFVNSSDALYQFVLLLQFALPPAMNIGVITQLFGAGESECSIIMLWTYSLASLSLTFWSTLFMWLLSN